MGKKKLPKVSLPEMEAMLAGMQDLLTDEYGNPLPPDHPHMKTLQQLAQQLNHARDGEASFPLKGEA